ncbi:MAG: PQQ-binding-like beta-propeller repeat protein [Planctomycetes bacterium]|nr:PQQ-binding-like beta-propeller repeat protein [Planctomycetota bacterium]
MKARLLLVALVGALVLPTGCASAKSKLEGRYEQGLRPFTHSGLEDAGIAVAWEQTLSSKQDKIKVEVSAAYLYKDIILVADTDNTLYAFDRQTGQKAWIALLPRPLKFEPTLFGGTLYCVCGKRLVTIDENGHMEMGPEFGVSLSAPPLMTEDAVYVAGSEGEFHRLDREKLSDMWITPARYSGVVLRRPVLLGSYVLVGNTAGDILGFDVITGGRAVELETRGPVSGGVSTDEDSIYAGSADFHVYALTGHNTLKWKTIVPGQVIRPPVIYGYLLYVDALGGGVLALDKKEGNIVWKNSGAVRFLAADKENVYAEGPHKELWVLDAGTGKTGERLEIGAFTFLLESTFNDGLVYLVSEDGRITCLNKAE